MHQCELPDVTFHGGARPEGRYQSAGWKCPDCGREWSASAWEPFKREPELPQRADADPYWKVMLWPDPMAGPYRLRVWFAVIAGRPAIVGTELWGREPIVEAWPPVDIDLADTAVSAAGSRVRIGELLDQEVARNQSFARAALQLWPDAAGQEQRVHDFAARRAIDNRAAPTGRPRLSPEHLEEVERVWQEALATGHFRKPAVVVAEHFTRELGRTVKPSTVRDWKRKASQRRHGETDITNKETKP